MTMQVIKAYFDRTKMRAIPGKIDYYFSPQKNDVDEEDGDEDDNDNFDDNFKAIFDEEDVEHMINAGLFPFEEEDEGACPSISTARRSWLWLLRLFEYPWPGVRSQHSDRLGRLAELDKHSCADYPQWLYLQDVRGYASSS